ncbi:hypothetical protein Tco_0090971 [Tanacetum coccineum]
MLKVSPWKGVIRFRKRRKLNPRYIGSFKIIAKVGTIAYQLDLLEQLSRVHSTFHVLNLKKCMSDETLVIPLDEIQVDDKLYFIEEPVEIMDREVKHLKQSHIPIVKFRWNYRRGPAFTWEREDQMQKKYPRLFANPEPSSNATQGKVKQFQGILAALCADCHPDTHVFCQCPLALDCLFEYYFRCAKCLIILKDNDGKEGSHVRFVKEAADSVMILKQQLLQSTTTTERVRDSRTETYIFGSECDVDIVQCMIFDGFGISCCFRLRGR